VNDHKQNRLSILFGFSLLFMVTGMGIVIGTSLLVLGLIFIAISVLFLFIFIGLLIAISRKEVRKSEKEEEEKRNQRLQMLDQERKQIRKIATKSNNQKELVEQKNLQAYLLKTMKRLTVLANDFIFCYDNNLPLIIDELEPTTICAICKLGLKNEMQALQCPFCKSIFHITHLLTWMYEHQNCPVCKEQLKGKIKQRK
jgi:uncharacterized membrane protein